MKHSFNKILSVALLVIALPMTALAQIPRINTFFPIGGRVGTTVSVEIRGSSLDGASHLLVHGQGVSGNVGVSGGKGDEAGKSVFQAKCGTCHELRSPANRSLTQQQWQQTIDRMIKVRLAPITPAESDKIMGLFVGQIKNGKLSAEIKIANDAMPGLYELRVVTNKGVSTVGLFEVGTFPELTAISATRQTAQKVSLPCVVNGCIANNGERHYLRFSAKKGDRLVFNLKGDRYHEEKNLYFNPNLRLYNSTGKEIEENHGYYDLDPLIDWTAPEDSFYTLEVRDLLGRGNPGSVYRLTMGAIPYDTVVFPAAAQVGVASAFNLIGKNTGKIETGFKPPMPTETGVRNIGNAFGSNPMLISEFPVASDETKSSAPTVLPSAFTGIIRKAGETGAFAITGDGDYDFEGYNGRLNSPGNMAYSLLDSGGKQIERTGNDGRMRHHLDAGKTYSLKIEEASGKGGEEFVYAVEAHLAHPRLEVIARPANITLRPNLTTAVEVIVTKRDGLLGDITVRAEDLPPGVTALAAKISADRTEAFLLLTASASAKPVQVPIKLIATGRTKDGLNQTVKVQAQEIYRIQNQDKTLNRQDCVVAVRGQVDFYAAFANGDAIKCHPRKVTEVTVKLKRRPDFKGNVTARLVNLPRGWVCYEESVGGDKDELILKIRPDGNDTRPFMTRSSGQTPIRAILEARSDEFQFAMGWAICVKDESPSKD